ncbi:MAG: hypothetical protein J0I20_31040 [Chloroflexi bacterium]|nr:hypothetical protein [Chloroflexota bacterium]OJV94158.1 MAG: hypothetical protein BGO39_11875 [Chloroflexi bacterium 54-19]
MINQTLVYFNENLRNAYLKESYLQAEIEEMRLEALQAQLDYREQGRNTKRQGQGASNPFKAAFARLTGRTTASTTR